MSAGETAPGRVLRAVARWAACAAWLLLVASAQAIDDPNAPDRIGAFNTRAAVFEDKLGQTSGGAESVEAGQAYATFLDTELNHVYRRLLAELKEPARGALQASQRQWLRFRDTELLFGQAQWTMQRSGSSYALSRALHRSELLKQRVLALLATLQEYPDPPKR